MKEEGQQTVRQENIVTQRLCDRRFGIVPDKLGQATSTGWRGLHGLLRLECKPRSAPQELILPPFLATQRLCDRRFGIVSDKLLLPSGQKEHLNRRACHLRQVYFCFIFSLEIQET
jgi:hypothetical protein